MRKVAWAFEELQPCGVVQVLETISPFLQSRIARRPSLRTIGSVLAQRSVPRVEMPTFGCRFTNAEQISDLHLSLRGLKPVFRDEVFAQYGPRIH